MHNHMILMNILTWPQISFEVKICNFGHIKKNALGTLFSEDTLKEQDREIPDLGVSIFRITILQTNPLRLLTWKKYVNPLTVD